MRRFILALRRVVDRGRVATALAGWLFWRLMEQGAMAEDATDSAPSGPGSKTTFAYAIVVLCIALGVMIATRSASRSPEVKDLEESE